MSISEPFIRRPVATSLLTRRPCCWPGRVAYRLLPVAPLPQVEFPTIQVGARLPGASPETMASAVATPLERQFGRIAGVTEMTSTSSLGATNDHAAVRSEPQHRRRRARRAGRHQRRARPAARQPAEQSDLPQGQPGRRADHDPGAHLRHATGRPDVRRRRLDPGAEALAGRRRRPGDRRRRRAARPCASRSNPDAARASSASASRRCARRSRAANANRPKGALAGATRRGPSAPTISSSRPTQYRPLIVAYRNGAAGAARATSPTVDDSVEDLRNAGLANGKPRRAHHHLPPARRQHHRDGRPRPRAAAAAPGVDPAGDQARRRARPHHHIRASVRRRRVHAASSPSCSSSWSSSSSCAACGPRSSRASPCRSRWSARSA